MKGGVNLVKLCGSSSANLTNCSVTQSAKGLEVGNRSKLNLNNCQISHCQVGISRLSDGHLNLNGCQVSENEEHGVILYGFDRETKKISDVEQVEKEALEQGVKMSNCEFKNNKFGHLLVDEEMETKMADMSLHKSLSLFRRSSTPRPTRLQYSKCRGGSDQSSHESSLEEFKNDQSGNIEGQNNDSI
jgi:hypothetical protein